LELLESWLRSGIKVKKLDGVRKCWEKNTHTTLTGSSHMKDYIPVLRAAHLVELRTWIGENWVALALDAASREGECFALTVRIINRESFVAETCLVAMRMYASSFNGAALAAVLNQISAELRIQPQKIAATVRDRAAYGRVAMKTLHPLWPCALDMECFAHTLNHVGEKMHHPHVRCLLSARSRSSRRC
jgi:hypothetical protein